MYALLVAKYILVTILFLPGVLKILAFSYQDAFGRTNYGFKCGDKIYKKHEIFAAAKKYCDALTTRPEVTREHYEHNGYPALWMRLMMESLLSAPGGPFKLMPILRDGSLYPIDLPKESRVLKSLNGESHLIDPGPDRIVVSKSCNVITAFTDFGYFDSSVLRIETCDLLRNPVDSSLTPSNSHDLS
ncbi:hypothetical protein EV44_g0531 [Erysiphe necator]|uniref:Uncharacterized protein n=1 Tax=Uncinula necator TaxID=52586 RepID=A0A0B1P3I2_UNCNE|nr:hypothetical protein EV44_g0531 [Erysiphe necator]